MQCVDGKLGGRASLAFNSVRLPLEHITVKKSLCKKWIGNNPCFRLLHKNGFHKNGGRNIKHNVKKENKVIYFSDYCIYFHLPVNNGYEIIYLSSCFLLSHSWHFPLCCAVHFLRKRHHLLAVCSNCLTLARAVWCKWPRICDRSSAIIRK